MSPRKTRGAKPKLEEKVAAKKVVEAEKGEQGKPGRPPFFADGYPLLHNSSYRDDLKNTTLGRNKKDGKEKPEKRPAANAALSATLPSKRPRTGKQKSAARGRPASPTSSDESRIPLHNTWKVRGGWVDGLVSYLNSQIVNHNPPLNVLERLHVARKLEKKCFESLSDRMRVYE